MMTLEEDLRVDTSRTFARQVVLDGHTLELVEGGMLQVEGSGVGYLHDRRSVVRVDGGRYEGLFLANVDLELVGGGRLVLAGGGLPLNEVRIQIGREARAILEFPNKDEKWVRDYLETNTKRDGRKARAGREFVIAERNGGGVEVTFQPVLP
jgi:hypothetical protein